MATDSLNVKTQTVLLKDCGYLHRWAAGTYYYYQTSRRQFFNVESTYKASGKTSFVNVIGSGQVRPLSSWSHSNTRVHLGPSGTRKWYRPSGSMYGTFARETSRSRSGTLLVRLASLHVPIHPPGPVTPQASQSSAQPGNDIAAAWTS
jgi:hypothetical protein